MRMKYTVIIEEGKHSFGAYVPDIPGIVAVAGSKEDVLQLIGDTLRGHIVHLESTGEDIPLAKSGSTMIEI